jgi:peptidoglycan/LPS O-acetylase OafA/YrhL
MLDYTDVPYLMGIKENMGHVTTCMLAAFMFMSGYFLSKYTFETKAEIIGFYKKRLTRFFPLFLLSAILLYRLGYNPDWLQLLFTLTGLSSYVGHQSGTIWFLSMLFSFYMITPFVVRGLERIQFGVWIKAIVVMLVCIVFICILSRTSLDYDKRLSYTMPFYGLGLILGRGPFIKTISSKWYILFLSALMLILLHAFNIVGVRYLHIDTVVAIILFLCVCYWLQILPIGTIISFVSYASMAMYLFHRPIFHMGIKYMLHEQKATISEVSLILMPIVIVASYVIQYSYDFCVDKVEHKYKK